MTAPSGATEPARFRGRLGMIWVQASLLARGLSRGWGGICRTALSGAPTAQVSLQAPRGLHCSAVTHKDEEWLVPQPPEPQRKPIKVPVVHEELFKPSANGEQDKASFLRAVRSFGEHSVRKRGHVDFIYLALRKMPEFGVERDLSVYNLLLDIFPKEVFRPRNVIQRIFVHYPRQQECGIAVLEQMETHGLMPNAETEFLLTQVFGRKSYPMLKFLRMKLWFTRFKNINPYPVPQDLPQDPLDLAKLSLRHMEPDLSAKVTVYQMSLPNDSTGTDPTQPHIVGIQSPDQQAALAHHNPSKPVFKVEEIPEEWNLYYPMKLDLEYSRSGWDNYEFNVDEVTEGPIFAMCIAGAHDQATLVKWIQGLQETNPALAQVPVVFRLARSTGELLTTSRLEEQSPPHSSPKGQEEDEAPQAQQQRGQS
ncbi:hypothetical protein A6R68_18182 [Neotoma lepida]|uniref:Evolutionarily conserved signaling intermediate in Toll pathway, mitochondrial n=1 Tax=Neotoma lepida TaxID=56216 RepID=A0A1A6HMB4_NEOLE|nr:hypothetical protein A6R68_18182 [Neotoma lepida]